MTLKTPSRQLPSLPPVQIGKAYLAGGLLHAPKLYTNGSFGMDSETLAAYEARAAEAEQRLVALEQALGGGGTGGNDLEFRKTVMASLLTLRTQLGTARCEQKELAAENSAALAEAAKLKEENEKLKYQVTHLTRSLQEFTRPQ
ncbi:hypothetical protein CYMTET_55402 [Cymbomonas tetramitiformis]|uniref:Uncharacterized protein n=1 Tax=Cymbomonas tetramitiformis TaxID=36881 RepID=A0AAE0EMV0_9CHLO|nr:hypothetical protein CYMTET_55402 [Cymbomonas tetramitiformis]